MILARLLAVMLLACSALAFAQKKNDSVPGPDPSTVPSKSPQAATPDPWNILERPRVDAGDNRPTQSQIDEYTIQQFRIDRSGRSVLAGFPADPTIADPSIQTDDDTLCYAIRSYRVARDDKDSDSVHPAGYTTCQPASRYRLRTAQASESPER